MIDKSLPSAMPARAFPAGLEDKYGLLRSKFEKLDEGGKRFLTSYVNLLAEYQTAATPVSLAAAPGGGVKVEKGGSYERE